MVIHIFILDEISSISFATLLDSENSERNRKPRRRKRVDKNEDKLSVCLELILK